MLLTGNTIVAKPSPYTPLTTLRIGELLADVVPAGVLNVISGGDSLGPRLSEHPGIRKIAFTGSTATGRKVMASAARSLTRVTLELGGNDAAIVLPDVDVDEVAPRVFWTCFGNSGQICIAAKRVYVHEDVYDAFAKRFAQIARSVKVGNGLEEGVQLGPIQNRAQYEKVVGLIKETVDSGAKLLVEGSIPDGPGYFVHPTVVDDPADDSAIVTQEPFGPVVPLLRFRDVDEVVRRANDSEYGLGGTVWSRDLAAAEELAARIETGTVWINQEQMLSPMQQFSGHKASGLGTENGVEGVLEYTQHPGAVRPQGIAQGRSPTPAIRCSAPTHRSVPAHRVPGLSKERLWPVVGMLLVIFSGGYCWDVALSLGSLPVVEAAGLVAAADADQRGGVVDALEASAVALGCCRTPHHLVSSGCSSDSVVASSRSTRTSTHPPQPPSPTSPSATRARTRDRCPTSGSTPV